MVKGVRNYEWGRPTPQNRNGRMGGDLETDKIEARLCNNLKTILRLATMRIVTSSW